jgi:RNA polymerase sigma-70 factor (ECF subfamily)
MLVDSAHLSTARVAEPEGDRGAEGVLSFDHVYEENFAFVWRSARRLGVSESALDDVVQEIFLVVHRRLAEFEGRSSLKTWLFGIVLRVVRDHRRSLRRKSPHSVRPEAAVDPDALTDARSASPHESAAKAEAVRVLHRLLDELDDDKREVFVLAELEQVSAPEIAAAIGVNLNTVYSRLRAARQAFEDALARHHARDQWRMR